MGAIFLEISASEKPGRAVLLLGSESWLALDGCISQTGASVLPLPTSLRRPVPVLRCSSATLWPAMFRHRVARDRYRGGCSTLRRCRRCSRGARRHSKCRPSWVWSAFLSTMPACCTLHRWTRSISRSGMRCWLSTRPAASPLQLSLPARIVASGKGIRTAGLASHRPTQSALMPARWMTA